MSVLVLAHDSDRVADRVAAELAGRGVPVARLNPSSFPQQLSMQAQITRFGPWQGGLRSAGGEAIDLGRVHAVWQRRSSQFVMDEQMSGPERAFAYGEARRGLGGVQAALAGCLWVNDPMAAARAEYKPVQLAAATGVGLDIPDTLITSDPEAAHAWAVRLGGPVVYKPLSGVWHADEGEVKVIYTSPVDDPELLLDQRLALTAHLFQEQIAKEFEARLIVIGERVFAVRIDAGSDRSRADWRADYDALTYTVIEPPAEVTGKLVELHRRLGLVYGAVDMICEPSGRWVFLETNQGGEFGWLAEETGLPIPAAMADLLERGT
ncbi:MAG: ATP-grasp ribosomal peptide maturase [Streptosporangiales bacterium]|nr:ATP-grasp ribosomal peptide maturase [Streptosporangiales bacterium]